MNSIVEILGVADLNAANVALRTCFVNIEQATPTNIALVRLFAERLGLNPLAGEFAVSFDQAGKVVPVVKIDGWFRLVAEHPQYDGMDVEYGPQTTTPNGFSAAEWVEVRLWRKDRQRPTVAREWLQECYWPMTAWDTHPNRCLRHKAFSQSARMAFAFGVVEPDELERALALTRKPEAKQAPKDPAKATVLSAASTNPPAPEPAPATVKAEEEVVSEPAPQPHPSVAEVTVSTSDSTDVSSKVKADVKTLIARARIDGNWPGAREWARNRFNGGELAFAMSQLEQAEAA